MTLKALFVPFFFAASIGLSTSAFATVKLETCSLSGTIRLEADTQLYCNSDLMVQAGTKIISQGFALFIAAQGSLHMDGQGQAGLEILAFDDQTSNAIRNAGPIEIYALTAYGKLEIHNNGATPSDMSGAVKLEFVSVKNYEQNIYADAKSPVDLVLNGSPAVLRGPTFQL